MDRFLEANAALALFSRHYLELKKGLPVRPGEMAVLNIITQRPGRHTPAMLAERLNVSKPMITAHLTALAENGYIIREQSEEDRRVYHILPTEKGLALAESAKKEMDRQLTKMSEVMGQADFDAFVGLARVAYAALKEVEIHGSER